MHRNTYLNSPGMLSADYSMISHPNVFFAGQMTGVEGYVESAGSGLVAGINAALMALAPEKDYNIIFPEVTMIGAMAAYVSRGGVSGKFTPMNANFGIVAPLGYKVKGGKVARYEVVAERALNKLDEYKIEIEKIFAGETL